MKKILLLFIIMNIFMGCSSLRELEKKSQENERLYNEKVKIGEIEPLEFKLHRGVIIAVGRENSYFGGKDIEKTEYITFSIKKEGLKRRISYETGFFIGKTDLNKNSEFNKIIVPGQLVGYELKIKYRIYKIGNNGRVNIGGGVRLSDIFVSYMKSGIINEEGHIDISDIYGLAGVDYLWKEKRYINMEIYYTGSDGYFICDGLKRNIDGGSGVGCRVEIGNYF